MISQAVTSPSPSQRSPLSLWIDAYHYLSSLNGSTPSVVPLRLWEPAVAESCYKKQRDDAGTHALHITYMLRSLPQTDTQIHTHTRTDRQTDTSAPAIKHFCSWAEASGVMNRGEDQRRERASDRWAEASAARGSRCTYANKIFSSAKNITKGDQSRLCMY